MTLKERIYKKIRQTLFIENIYEKYSVQNDLLIDKYLQEHLYNNPKYLSNKRLTRYEFQAFSQFGEDGIIEEIFKRIGTTNKYFVEFGVENGIETNTTYLLHQHWQGLWIDGSAANIYAIGSSFNKCIKQGRLNAVQRFITAENIEQIFTDNNVPKEFDLLSIDIDRNDFYVWDAIKSFSPRVVVIEYNAVFRPGSEFVVEYDANAVWDKTSYHGASLESLTKLGLEKGYKLIGCSFAGLNAFFVKENICDNLFEEPYSTENHYENPKYFLYNKQGHPRRVFL